MVQCLEFVLKDPQGGKCGMGRLNEYDQILSVVEALRQIQEDSLCSSHYFCVGLKIIIVSRVVFFLTQLISRLNEAQVLYVLAQKEFSERQSDR